MTTTLHTPLVDTIDPEILTTLDKRADEIAVMVDTYLPLFPTVQAANLEDAGYHDSWRTQG